MRRCSMFVILVLSLWGSLADAGTPRARAPSPTPETWTGTVIDARSGERIAGVAVTAYDQRMAVSLAQGDRVPDAPRPSSGEPIGEPATSDTDGSFFAAATGAGNLMLTSPGYLDGFIDLPPGRDPDLGTIAMDPATVLRGRIVDASGPVAGKSVGVIHYTKEEAPEHLTRTDQDGFFTLDGVALSRFTTRFFVVEGFGVLFEFKQLPRREFDLGEIRLPELHRVIGSVVDTDGVPVAGARVAMGNRFHVTARFTAGARLTRMFGTTGADGDFEVLVPEGTYELSVQALGRIREGVGTGEIEVGSELDLGTLALPPLVEITGTAVDEQGVPVAGVVVELAASWRAGGWYEGDFRLARTTTDATGAYTLPISSTIERPVLNFLRPGHVPVDDTLTIRSPLRAQRSVDAARRQQDPVVLPREDTAIVGRVIDEQGNGVASVWIHYQRAFENPGYTMGIAAQTNQDGRFQASALHAGEWSLSVGGGEYDRVTQRGINVGRGETVEATLQLRRVVQRGAGRPIDVRVVDLADRPVIGVRVHFDAQGNTGDTPSYRGQRLSGADGRVRFDDVPDGIFQIWGTHLFLGRLETREVRVGPNYRTSVVSFRPARRPFARLTGRVVGPDGRPIVGASIIAEVSREPPRQTGITQFQHATSDGTGAFELVGMPAARYTVRAWRRGLATTRLAGELDVTPEGLDEVEIILESGASVLATIRGLSAEELRDVSVQVNAGAHDETGPVRRDDDGTFRVENVGRGAWVVSARTRAGRAASTPIEVPVGAKEINADIEFASGFTLQGLVRFRGQPVAASIRISGKERREGRSRHVVTGEDGVYEVRDLYADDYHLFIQARSMRSPFVQEIRVDGDTVHDIDIRGGVLGGRLVDASTGEGIADGHLRIGPVAQNLGADTFPDFPGLSVDGRFHVGPLAGVPWRLEANAPGYATEIVIVPLEDADIEDIELRLEPSPGLALTIDTAFGAVRDNLHFYWQSLDGSRVYRRSLYSSQVTEYQWDTVPLGEGILTVISYRVDLIKRMHIDNRGEPIRVVLEPAGFLDLTVEGLEEEENTRVEVLDEHGLGQFAWGRGAISGAPWMRLREGRRQTGLAAGHYTLIVTADDGREWRQEVEIMARQVTEITLR